MPRARVHINCGFRSIRRGHIELLRLDPAAHDASLIRQSDRGIDWVAGLGGLYLCKVMLIDQWRANSLAASGERR